MIRRCSALVFSLLLFGAPLADARQIAERSESPDRPTRWSQPNLGEGEMRPNILAQIPRSAVDFKNRGNDRYRAGRYAEAEADYREAIRLDPSYAIAHNNLCVVLNDRGRYNEALDACLQAIELDNYYANAYNSLGNVLVGLEEYGEAEGIYRRAIQLDSVDPLPHHGLGRMLLDRGEYADAEAAYRDAVTRGPRDPDAYSGLGITLTAREQYRDAEEVYREALTFASSNAALHNGLGFLLLRVGRYDEAIDALNRAIALDPSFPEPQTNLREAEYRAANASLPDHSGNALNSVRTRDLPGDRLSRLQRSVVRITTTTPTRIREGSGWVLSRDGDTLHIVTNRHVLTHNGKADGDYFNEKIEVDWFGGGSLRQPARVMHLSEDPDLAILKVSNAPDDIEPLTPRFEPPALLSEILAIGHPTMGAPWTVVRGAVSHSNDKYLQIDATVAPGNSGGPVFDDNDRVIGMMQSLTADTRGLDNFALAYPLERLRPKLEAWGVL